MLRLAQILILTLLLPQNVMAAKTNAQDAQKLKTSFENILAYQKDVNEALGSVKVIYKGDLNVTQESEFYTITFPHIILESPETQSDETATEETNETFDMGVISINAMRDDKNPGHWKTVWSMPSSMTLKDNTDEDFTIEFGGQNIIALFDEQLGYFTKMNLNLSDISFKVGDEDVGASIGNTQLYANLEKNDSGNFSGPVNFVISNLLIAPPEEEGIIKTEEIKIASDVTDMELPTLSEYKEKLLSHANAFKSLENAQDPSKSDDIEPTEIFDMVFDMYDVGLAGISVNYSLKNMDISIDPNEEGRKFDTLKIGSAFLGFGSNDVNTEKGSLNIGIGYDGIDIKTQEPDDVFATILPTQTNLDIKAENIPFQSLYQMTKNSAKAIATNPQSANGVGFGFMMKLPAILSQANTKLVVKNNGAGNETYDISLNGEVATDITALMGFSAKFIAVFNGLDDLLSKIPTDTDNFEAASIIQQLKHIKSVGKPGKGKDGKTSYTYELEATPQGEFTLNGQDTREISAQPPQ
ncbi:MAG: hypothetical protein ACRBB3_01800 [Alphaproteobacteria bacterium]